MSLDPLLFQTLEYYFRIILSAFLSGLIGLERKKAKRPAGSRTHLLVGMGATLAVISVAQVLPGQDSMFRVAAAVIQGIGFLGAGVILKTGSQVQGLTTAASIWFVATLGITVGLGQYDIAILSSLIALATLRIKYLGGLGGIRNRKVSGKKG